MDFLAAAGIALTWINITSIPLYRGFCPSLVTLASQAFYSDDLGLMQTYLQMAIFFSTIFCWVLVVGWWYSGPLAQWALGEAVCNAQCADLVTAFTRYSSLWLWPMAAFDQFEGLMQCRGEVMPAMVVNVIFVVINAMLNQVPPPPFCPVEAAQLLPHSGRREGTRTASHCPRDTHNHGTELAMKVVRQARLELSGGSTPDLLRPPPALPLPAD